MRKKRACWSLTETTAKRGWSQSAKPGLKRVLFNDPASAERKQSQGKPLRDNAFLCPVNKQALYIPGHLF